MKLLAGPSIEMSNEMERTYRGIINIVGEDFSPVTLSAKGILKARLFGVTFMLYPYGKKWPDDAGFSEMMNASSGLAMLPFETPSYQPKIDRTVAASFAGDYMKEVFQAIVSEMKNGPSTPVNMSVGFNTLVNLYEDALKETIGRTYTSAVRKSILPTIAGGVTANLSHMVAWVDEL